MLTLVSGSLEHSSKLWSIPPMAVSRHPLPTRYLGGESQPPTRWQTPMLEESRPHHGGGCNSRLLNPGGPQKRATLSISRKHLHVGIVNSLQLSPLSSPTACLFLHLHP